MLIVVIDILLLLEHLAIWSVVITDGDDDSVDRKLK